METVLDFIPTKSSMLNENVKKDFEAVTYTSYKKKVKDNPNSTTDQQQSNNNVTFDVKKARHDILKFGMSGFDQQKKHKAKVQLAIKLGAKPPKNAYKNYKELLEEKAKQKLTDKRDLQLRQLGKNEFGESLAKSKKYVYKRKVVKGNLLEAYGTVQVKNK